MTTNLIIGLAVLAFGLVLLVMGFNASRAPLEQISEAITGRFSGQTMWYLVFGAMAVVIGGALTFAARRT